MTRLALVVLAVAVLTHTWTIAAVAAVRRIAAGRL